MQKDQQFWELRLGMDFLTIMFLLSSQQGVSVNPNPNPKTEFFKKKNRPRPRPRVLLTPRGDGKKAEIG